MNTLVQADYIATIIPELAPAWIDHVLRYHGRAPPRAGRRPPFRYVDLGCGPGLGVAAYAAAYPEGEFVGVDASASHVEIGRRFAREVGLENIRFIAGFFGDDDVLELGPVDYAVANGVYSWVGDAARDDLFKAIDRLLKPGGAAVVSANTVVGWLTLMPMQKLFAELTTATPGRSTQEIVANFKGVAAALDAAARNDLIKDGASRYGEMAEKFPHGYVAHEFLVDAWRPIWTLELMRRFADVGCDYLGGGRLSAMRDDFAFGKAQRDLLATAPSVGAALTLRDMFLRQGHFHGVAARPGPGAISGAPPSRLDGWARLDREPGDVEYHAETDAGRLKFDNAVARRIVAALAGGARPLREIAAAADASGEAAFHRVMDGLFASEQALPVDPPTDDGGLCARFADLAAERGYVGGPAPDPHGTPRRPI